MQKSERKVTFRPFLNSNFQLTSNDYDLVLLGNRKITVGLRRKNRDFDNYFCKKPDFVWFHPTYALRTDYSNKIGWVLANFFQYSKF